MALIMMLVMLIAGICLGVWMLMMVWAGICLFIGVCCRTTVLPFMTVGWFKNASAADRWVVAGVVSFPFLLCVGFLAAMRLLT